MRHSTVIIALLVLSNTAFGQGRMMVRAGVGTDVQLGLGLGVGGSYAFDAGGFTLEVGPDFFYHASSETSMEYGNTYDEKFSMMLFGVRANTLYGYDPDDIGLYAVVGVGLAAVHVEWSEYSPTDYTANDSGDGTTVASILNLGAGYNLGGFDLRLELPILVLFGVGGQTRVAPTITLMAGYRF